MHNVVLSVDSQEEVDFVNWLCEAHTLSVINDFQYQPSSFELFENTKYTDIYGKTRTLFQEHVYSCDFMVMFNPNTQKELAKELKIPYSQLSCTEVSAYIDTKGTFNRNSRSFSTDRKWVWDKYGIYVAEIIPVKFFKNFGVPLKSFISKKTKKARKMFLGMKPLAKMLKSRLD